MGKCELLLEDATVGYPNQIILDSVNLRIQAGQAVLLLGENGTGKTTLIRTVLGFLPLLKGQRYNSFQNIQYVPQVNIIDKQYPLTVRQCIFSGRRGMPWPWVRAAANYAEVLGMCGLQGKEMKLIRECSSGELQRALLARSILSKPDLVILDEPTSSMDKKGKKDTLDLLLELANTSRTSILLCTHELDKKVEKLFSVRIMVGDGQARLVD